MLLAFTESAPELDAVDLARRAGLGEATAGRVIATLLELGLLEPSDDGRRYRLALGLFELGLLALRHRPVFVHAEPLLERLAEEAGETATLAVFSDRDVVFLAKADATPRLPLALGRRYPASCCAAGKALLAWSDSAGTIRPSPGSELAAARAAGHAVDHEELFAGVSSIAVPVLEPSGHAVAALSLSGPAARLGRQLLPDLAPGLHRAASDLSRRLGSRPSPVRLAG